MMTKIEQMGLDLYNALRGPLSQMESADEMDNFKINEMISGMNTNIIAECMKCAQINIESGESMKRAGVHMNWAMIDYYNNLIIEACKNAMNKEEKEMKKENAQVNVIEITVDGIKYTNTRPGYYYKKVDGKTVRIPKAEWEQAFDQYTQISKADEDWDMGQEIEARKAEQEKTQAESDKIAEDAMNKCGDGTPLNEVGKQIAEQAKKKAKKAPVKKARRSKDVAFEMDTIEGHITLTAKQVDFIKHIPDTCFYENGLESTPWCDVLADEIGGQFAGKPMTVGAMISTLREKNLIYVSIGDNGKKAKFFGFTDLGKVIAQKLGLN